MKKIINLAVLMLFVLHIGYAQNEEGTLDDIGRISLTPVLSDNTDDNMTQSSKRMLLSKLRQIATKNGMAATSLSPQFLITETVNVLNKDITETVPPMISYTVEVNLYIVDYANQKVLSNVTLELRGAGKNETKAMSSALRRINPRASKIRSFVKKGKKKIIEYYNTQCEMILKQAKTFEKVEAYEDAIATLMSVPEVCKECYYKSLDAVEPIYRKMKGENCKEDLEAAKAAIKNEDMEAAKDYLEGIEPGTDCYDNAVDLAKKLNNTAPESRGFEGEVKMKAAAPATREEKVQAYKEAASSSSNKKKQTDDYDLNFMNED